jgi:hypothetical protein
MLLRNLPLIYRRRAGKPRRVKTAGPVVVPLTLASATYSVLAQTLTLSFDRAIDIDAIDGSAISVEDQPNGLKWNATGGATLLSATTVRLLLVEIDSATGSQVLMTATSANGIVAVDDGASWAGVSDLALPWP